MDLPWYCHSMTVVAHRWKFRNKRYRFPQKDGIFVSSFHLLLSMLLIEQIPLHGDSSEIKLRKESSILQWTETENRIAIFKAGNSFPCSQTQGSHHLSSGQAPWKFNDHNREFPHSCFFKSFYYLEKLITMSNGTSQTLMCWETLSLVKSFKFFQQQCNLYFFVKSIPEDKQVDNIL